MPAATFALSFVSAALLFGHVVPARVPEAAARATPLSAFAGSPLTRLPSALDVRLVPLSGAATVTRWAPVLRTTIARRAPGARSAPIGLMPSRTPDGTANIVVADAESNANGTTWVRVGLSILPNDTEGWVPRSALGGWSFVRTHLVIDLARFTATLFWSGRIIFRAPIGVGGPGTPTPTGQFYVRDRLGGFSNPIYGPLAFGTNARSPTLTDWPGGGVVGIHGTNQPELIPGRISHGCIRLTNAAIVRLGRLMPIGTPVTIE